MKPESAEPLAQELEQLVQDAAAETAEDSSLAEVPDEASCSQAGGASQAPLSPSRKGRRFWFYFGLLQLSLLLYSFSGICSKYAARRLGAPDGGLFDPLFILCFGLLFLILFIYALLWQPILKEMPLTLAYSSKAVTIVWGLIWGAWIFAEHISLNHILGALIIIGGICFVNARD